MQQSQFLPQVVQFQRNCHHRFLITGRPLSLQGIERVITQAKDDLQRAELQPMSDPLREIWYQQWADKFGQDETEGLKQFLEACPKDVQYGLAREPLLLYLLGRMHRKGRLKAEMFEGTDGTEAKVVIYDEVVRWVIEEQRQNENVRQVGLEPEDLRQALTEAAVCVMQSGNEVAKISFLEARLQQDINNPVYELLQRARHEVKVADDKLLNNLLTAFYIKPASGDKEGSVEFAHKSFGEFLFAERLKNALEDWSKPGERRNQKYLVSPADMCWEVYDLLGYGGLSVEVVAYLRVLLTKHSDFGPVLLFERLHDFYLRWWEGEFINAVSGNWPQKKMLALRERLPEREESLGLRQIDVLTGLNVMVLLFELHRYGQAHEDLSDALVFHPCGTPGTDNFESNRLSQIIGLSDCLRAGGFSVVAAPFLSGAYLAEADLRFNFLNTANLSCADLSQAFLYRINLYRANLYSANLSNTIFSSANLINADLGRANLSSADLRNADLSSADLSSANLSSANLSRANLSRANLSSANLSSANISSADLRSANLGSTNLRNANLSRADLNEIEWDVNTQWSDAKELHTAHNIPKDLSDESTFRAAVALSLGLQLAQAGEIPNALAAYQEAQSLNPALVISAYFWNQLCWFGCLHDYADKVHFAGENAVNLEPDDGYYRDTLALAEALTGKAQAAIANFKLALNSDDLSDTEREQRAAWAEALEAGENPFTPEVLAELRGEE
ncbi:MAG: pentapeptide repeat-containing protein [Cyanobacteria bacterium P01_H01_bin.153]